MLEVFCPDLSDQMERNIILKLRTLFQRSVSHSQCIRQTNLRGNKLCFSLAASSEEIVDKIKIHFYNPTGQSVQYEYSKEGELIGLSKFYKKYFPYSATPFVSVPSYLRGYPVTPINLPIKFSFSRNGLKRYRSRRETGYTLQYQRC